MADWGYYLLPKSHPDSPGFGGVAIAMRQTPTEQHFDPELIELRMIEQSEGTWTTLTFYSSLNGNKEVQPGRIIIIDRFEKHVEFFTFGAMVEEIRGLHDVVFVFTSDAPVLVVTGDTNDPGDQIASEADELLARRQALQMRHVMPGMPVTVHTQFAKNLYQTSLMETIQHYERVAMLKWARPRVYAALLHERARLISEGSWQTAAPPSANNFSQN